MAIANSQSLMTQPPRHRSNHSRLIPPALMMSAARDLANTLRQRGLPFAFCEDIAAYTYGVTRWVPRSIKIMISLGTSSVHELAESISSSNPDNLEYERSSGILIYHATSTSPNSDSSSSYYIQVQLLPTNRHPLHSESFIVERIPLVPFTFVLLGRLLEWDESDSDESAASKHKVVMAMLRYFRSNLSKPYCKPIRSFDSILHAASGDRVARFYDRQPSYLPEWKRMGFFTTEKNTSTGNTTAVSSTQFVPSLLVPSLETSLTISSQPTSPLQQSISLNVSPSPSEEKLQTQSTSLFVKCPPRILELLHDWDNEPTMKEAAAREIEAFLVSIRMGRQTLVTGPRQVLDPLVHAQVHRLFTEHNAWFLQWQKMGFFEGYSSKADVPPAPPKTDRGYLLPPKRVAYYSSSAALKSRDDKVSCQKKGKTTRKSARQQSFSASRLVAAEAVVSALNHLGLSCAIFGSMACHLYGSPRLPKDIDVLVLQPELPRTQEEIKDMLVRHMPDHFFLQSARDPSAPYQILYYRPSADTSSWKTTIKVDILLPGIMSLPSLAPHDIVDCSSLPVIPYSVLLLQKLQAWDDHRLSEEERYKKKVPIDAKDLMWLLAPSNVGDLLPKASTQHWSNRTFFSEAFEAVSRERIKTFCLAHPSSRELWSRLGLEDTGSRNTYQGQGLTCVMVTSGSS